MAMKARKYVIRGRVQGVGFRWYVEREARSIGLAGWVRNSEESTVEVLAVGEEERQALMLESLKRGPRAARVDQVETLEPTDEETIGHLKDFQIIGAW